MPQKPQDEKQKGKAEHESWLQTLPGVQGIGIGVDEEMSPCLKIFVNNLAAATRDSIRKQLAGVRYDIEDIGTVRKL